MKLGDRIRGSWFGEKTKKIKYLLVPRKDQGKKNASIKEI